MYTLSPSASGDLEKIENNDLMKRPGNDRRHCHGGCLMTLVGGSESVRFRIFIDQKTFTRSVSNSYQVF